MNDAPKAIKSVSSTKISGKATKNDYMYDEEDYEGYEESAEYVTIGDDITFTFAPAQDENGNYLVNTATNKINFIKF